MTGSLSDKNLLAETKQKEFIQILPEANVIKLGGQSFIDRDKAAIFFRLLRRLMKICRIIK
jgi:molybdenum storage protein